MSRLSDEMLAHALEAQKFTRKHLVVELDFSPQSVYELEQQIDAVDYAIKGGKSADNVRVLIRVWGSYLGEVLRRHGGGEWVEEPAENGTRIALRLGNQSLHPHERVRQRLSGGPEYSLVAFVEQARTATP